MIDAKEQVRLNLWEDIKWTRKMVDMYKDPTMMAWHMAYCDKYDEWFKGFSYKDSLAVRWELAFATRLTHLDFERYYEACSTLDKVHGKVVNL